MVEGAKCSFRSIDWRMISSLSRIAAIRDSGEAEIDRGPGALDEPSER